MNLRTTKEMERDGYLIYPFPARLSKAMKAHIIQFFGIDECPEIHNKLTETSLQFTEEKFIQKLAKPFRMFPDSVTTLVLDWVTNLADLFAAQRTGVNYVSLDERKKNPLLRENSYDIFWRCVRPGRPDVGAAHCDFQFWEIAKGTSAEVGAPFESDERWKIWIPLIGCGPTNSLQVVPGSHKQEVPTDRVMTPNGYKPVIQAEWIEKNETKFICPLTSFNDHCVLFHDKLVHRGPPNNTLGLRLSGELTILLKD